MPKQNISKCDFLLNSMIMADQHLYFNQNTLLLTVVVDSYKSTYIHNETFIIQLYFEFYKSSKICENLNIKFFINVERTRDLYLLSNIYWGSFLLKR